MRAGELDELQVDAHELAVLVTVDEVAADAAKRSTAQGMAIDVFDSQATAAICQAYNSAKTLGGHSGTLAQVTPAPPEP